MKWMLCIIAALASGIVGQAARAQEKDGKGVPDCKPGTSAKVTGSVVGTGAGSISLRDGAAGNCRVNSIRVNGKLPEGCKEDVRVSASGTIRHEPDQDEGGIYMLLDAKDLRCESGEDLAPPACKHGDVVTTTATIDRIEKVTAGEWVAHIGPSNAKGVCPFRHMQLFHAPPALCAKGASISGKGQSEAYISDDGLLDLWLMKTEGLQCRDVPEAASADARKDCERYDADLRIQGCTQLITENTENLPDIYTKRGGGYNMKKDYDRALADYDKAIELDPNHALAYSLRGGVRASKGEHDRAIADYDKALQLRPDFIVTYVQRGNSYAAKGDYEGALADYDRAIEISPEEAEAYCGRGDAYKAVGDDARAADEYQAAERIEEGICD